MPFRGTGFPLPALFRAPMPRAIQTTRNGCACSPRVDRCPLPPLRNVRHLRGPNPIRKGPIKTQIVFRPCHPPKASPESLLGIQTRLDQRVLPNKGIARPSGRSHPRPFHAGRVAPRPIIGFERACFLNFDPQKKHPPPRLAVHHLPIQHQKTRYPGFGPGRCTKPIRTVRFGPEPNEERGVVQNCFLGPPRRARGGIRPRELNQGPRHACCPTQTEALSPAESERHRCLAGAPLLFRYGQGIRCATLIAKGWGCGRPRGSLRLT